MLSGITVGLLATVLGAPRALLVLAGVVGVGVLGISTVIRSLWHSEMKEEAVPEAKASVVAVES